MRVSTCRRALFSAAIVLGCGGTAPAAILMDQIDQISGHRLTTSTSTRIYDDYKPASNSTLESIRVHGVESTLGFTSPNGAIVTIRSNEAPFDSSLQWNHPTAGAGGILYQQTGTWTSFSTTTDPGTLNRTGTFNINLPTTFSMTAGTTYWISVQPTFNDGGAHFDWSQRGPDTEFFAPLQTGDASVVMDGTGSSFSSYRVQSPGSIPGFDPDVWKYSTSDIKPVGTYYNMDMSFQVLGTAVPEPGTIGLLGTGAAGLLLRRRRSADC